jgi:predicted Zn-dependent protease with MMP-like domain
MYYEFPSIDEVNEILDEIAEELPQEFFEKLNEGIILMPEYKLHPESRARDKLYIMGEYCRSITGRNIVIYYGSFERVCGDLSQDELRERLKDTLLHEFTHHFESLAGERGLEIKDAEEMIKYRRGIR